MKKLSFMIIGLAFCTTLFAQEVKLDSVGRDAAYVKTIIGRSQKIVDGLHLNDARKAKNVLNIIANRYFKLSDFSDQYKDKNELQSQLYLHHFEFAADLANYLHENEIEAVKDGMTYGVVPKTYQAHLEMIPSLQENEKLQILNWLKEAREFAIDAGTSKEKHGWFGKYKGRINNWLAKRGYDLQKEREGWSQRLKAAKK